MEAVHGTCGARDERRGIEEVPAQHAQVLPASALIFLAASADLDDRTEGSAREAIDEHLQGRVVAIAVGDDDRHRAARGQRDDLVGFRERAREGLLHIETTGTSLDRRDHHVSMLVGMPRAHDDDVGANGGEHRAVIGEREPAC